MTGRGVVKLFLAALAASAAVAGCAAQAAQAPLMAKPYKAPAAGGNPGHIYPFTAGIALFVSTQWPLSQATATGKTAMDYIAHVLHLNGVQIAWNFNVPSRDASAVDASGPLTASPDVISSLTSEAEADGLKVTYRVLLKANGGGGSIHPSQVGPFFSSMYAAELPYLQIAEHYHIQEFIAGTERTNLTKQGSLWNSFFASAAKVYHGVLSYSEWGGEKGQGGFLFGQDTLMSLPMLGTTAYPNMNVAPTTSVAQLTTMWEQVLTAVPASILTRTAIDEVGIPSLDGSYAHPWLWPGTGNPDISIQANWFTAACAAARAEHMRGIWFWNLNLADNPATPKPSPVKFTGHSSVIAALRACAGA